MVVSHFNFMHFFLGVVLFGDAFGPEHLIPLHQAGHANTGITIFERKRALARRVRPVGVGADHLERPGAPVTV